MRHCSPCKSIALVVLVMLLGLTPICCDRETEPPNPLDGPGTGPTQPSTTPAPPRSDPVVVDAPTTAPADDPEEVAAQAIFDAIEAEDLDALAKAIESAPNVDVRGEFAHHWILPDGKNIRKIYVASALHVAAASGAQEAAVLLLEQGADPNLPSDVVGGAAYAGAPPLMFAAGVGDLEMTRLLLDKGAKIQGTNTPGTTALHSAAVYGHVEIATLLIERGANINHDLNTEGMAPIHAASKFGQIEVVRVLIKYGADVNLRQDNGQSARDIALDHGHPDIAELLEEHGG